MAWEFGAGLGSNLSGLGLGGGDWQLGQNIGGGKLADKISKIAPPGSGKMGLAALAALLGRRQSQQMDDGSFVMQDIYSDQAGLPQYTAPPKTDYTIPLLVGGGLLAIFLLKK